MQRFSQCILQPQPAEQATFRAGEISLYCVCVCVNIHIHIAH